MQKIMIIEDDPAIREELALLLGNEGYTPLVITEFTDVPNQAAQGHPESRFCTGDLRYQPGCRCGRGTGAEPGRGRLHYETI